MIKSQVNQMNTPQAQQLSILSCTGSLRQRTVVEFGLRLAAPAIHSLEEKKLSTGSTWQHFLKSKYSFSRIKTSVFTSRCDFNRMQNCSTVPKIKNLRYFYICEFSCNISSEKDEAFVFGSLEPPPPAKKKNEKHVTTNLYDL